MRIQGPRRGRRQPRPSRRLSDLIDLFPAQTLLADCDRSAIAVGFGSERSAWLRLQHLEGPGRLEPQHLEPRDGGEPAQLGIVTIVIDIDRLAVSAASFDFDEALREEPADPTDQALAFAQDHGIRAQLGADLGQDLLE